MRPPLKTPVSWCGAATAWVIKGAHAAGGLNGFYAAVDNGTFGLAGVKVEDKTNRDENWDNKEIGYGVFGKDSAPFTY